VIRAVLFDLDDTLYDQQRWLAGAWHAVAGHAAQRGVDVEPFERALRDLAADGSDQGGIIDRALARVGDPQVAVAPLVATFRSHAPEHLDPYPGVVDALEDLHTRVPLGLVSDGDPTIQRAKLAALDLARLFHTVVLSDEHGRAHRKPDPLPFRVALTGLGVDPADAIYVGDRPAKDVAGATAAGLRAIRVHTGEWRDDPDDPRAWASVPTVVDAIELLNRGLPASRRAPATVPSARG
jgi:putative hydrolase of the HAD superfamily